MIDDNAGDAEDNNAEAFDEDLLIPEGEDDSDVESMFPSSGYRGSLDKATTDTGEHESDTLEERIRQEEPDLVAEELQHNAEDIALENRAMRGDETPDVETAAALAELEDAAWDLKDE